MTDQRGKKSEFKPGKLKKFDLVLHPPCMEGLGSHFKDNQD